MSAQVEMWRTFNCGIGYTVIVARDAAAATIRALAQLGLARMDDRRNRDGDGRRTRAHRLRQFTRLFNLVVLASGRGSNFAALLAAQSSRSTADRIRRAAVGSRTGTGAGTSRARRNIPAVALRPRDYPDRAGFDHALFARSRGISTRPDRARRLYARDRRQRGRAMARSHDQYPSIAAAEISRPAHACSARSMPATHCMAPACITSPPNSMAAR